MAYNDGATWGSESGASRGVQWKSPWSGVRGEDPLKLKRQ